MKILMLTKDDMKKVFSMADAIEADKNALCLYSKGESNIPLRVKLNVPEYEGQSLYMPGYAAGANALGVKIVSVYPKNIEKGLTSVPATMVLLDSETGQICSLLDGTHLTCVRTGAVSGAATDILARKDSKVFALFGTGGQAESQLEAIINVRPIEEARIYDISKERATDFAKQMSDKFKIKVEVAASSADAIKDADIITCATTSKKPVFDGKLIKKGAHINGIGSYTPDMQEIDEYILVNANKVYVDTRDGVLNESGDLIIPINKGIYSSDKIAGELGEVIAGKVTGRTSDDEITIFKSTGTAVMDIVTAKAIYDNAVRKNIGSFVDF